MHYNNMEELRRGFINFLKEKPKHLDYVEFFFVHRGNLFRIAYENAFWANSTKKQRFICIQVANSFENNDRWECKYTADDNERINRNTSLTYDSLCELFELSPVILKVSLEMEMDKINKEDNFSKRKM